MTYTAEELERQFKNLGGSRRGRKKYANDAGYWKGGRCNWGGGHSLKEDCQTLVGSFNKIGSLRDIKEELKKCTSKDEYDAKKNNYIRKCEESLKGLQAKTGASSSMFGICIIWSDEAMDKHVLSKLTNFQEELTKLKDDLEREDYKWVQELKQLKLEEAQIKKKMEENKRKAMNEKDPAQKALLLQLIEDDGKKLKANMKRQQELSNKFNFDPSKKVDDLIESMKQAIKNSGNKNKPSGSGGKNKNPTDSSDSDDDENPDGEDDNDGNDDDDKGNKNQSNWFQDNKQLIIIGVVFCLALFYLYSQKQEKEPNYYDF